MNSWQEIQKTIEYIEQHFDEEIDIDKLAAIAHLSKYYYQRLFYRLTNKTVKEYVKLRRLAKASKLLKETDLRILDIAIKCGFSNHGNFSKVFKEVYDISPDRYRKTDIHLDQYIKPDIALNYILIDTGVPLIVDKMVLEINKKTIESDKCFIGKSKLALIKDLNQPKINNFIDLWQDLKLNNDQVGVDILTLSDQPEYFNYFVGVESKDSKEGYEVRVMPKGKYIVCSYEAENFDLLVNEALYKASRYLYDIWLPNHNLTPDSLLVQKYFNPFEDNCFIELWAKLK